MNTGNKKLIAQFIEWEDIRRDAKLPTDDNNEGYIYGIAYLDDEGVDTLDVEWFKTNEERYETVKNEQLEIINFIG